MKFILIANIVVLSIAAITITGLFIHTLKTDKSLFERKDKWLFIDTLLRLRKVLLVLLFLAKKNII